MTSKSMLADVFASANEKLVADSGEKGTAPVAGSQQENETMADKTTLAAVQPKTETVAELQAAYPVLCGQIATDAAKAERDRIQGLMSLPAAGHAALVTAAIADGSSTRAQLAERIMDAEATTRSKQKSAIEGVETVASVVIAAPSDGGANATAEKATTPDGWKAEFAASPKLQAEYLTAEAYVATKRREALKLVG